MISLTKHKKVIQYLREQCPKEIFFQKIRWENIWDKLKELKTYEAEEKDKGNMLTLNHELLSCRAPYSSYHVFLFEQMIMFQIKALKEGRP